MVFEKIVNAKENRQKSLPLSLLFLQLIILLCQHLQKQLKGR